VFIFLVFGSAGIFTATTAIDAKIAPAMSNAAILLIPQRGYSIAAVDVPVLMLTARIKEITCQFQLNFNK